MLDYLTQTFELISSQIKNFNLFDYIHPALLLIIATTGFTISSFHRIGKIVDKFGEKFKDED
jgi:hypothetical protein